MIAFLIWILVLCLVIYVVTYVLTHYLGAPSIVINIIWAVGILLILLYLVSMFGDIPFPRFQK